MELNWYVSTLSKFFLNQNRTDLRKHSKYGAMRQFLVTATMGRNGKKGGVEGMEGKLNEINLMLIPGLGLEDKTNW